MKEIGGAKVVPSPGSRHGSCMMKYKTADLNAAAVFICFQRARGGEGAPSGAMRGASLGLAYMGCLPGFVRVCMCVCVCVFKRFFLFGLGEREKHFCYEGFFSLWGRGEGGRGGEAGLPYVQDGKGGALGVAGMLDVRQERADALEGLGVDAECFFDGWFCMVVEGF